MNIKLLLYYTDLICEKIDLHSDEFMKRVDALREGDTERVEFIEKMVLEPLDAQIKHLADKASKICSK